MSKYILDTGIVLGYIRGASYAEYVENKYKIYDPANLALMSIVTVGELYSLSMQLGWGAQKRILLQKVLKNIPTQQF